MLFNQKVYIPFAEYLTKLGVGFMRSELKELGYNRRHMFIAEFNRYGTKRGWEGAVLETILLTNIRLKDSHKQVANHLWFNKTLGFGALGELKTGDIIVFEGRVDTYEKGYKGRYAEEQGESWTETDYKISRPTKIRLVKSSVSVADFKTL